MSKNIRGFMHSALLMGAGVSLLTPYAPRPMRLGGWGRLPKPMTKKKVKVKHKRMAQREARRTQRKHK